METESKHMQTVLVDNRTESYCVFFLFSFFVFFGMYAFNLKVKILKIVVGLFSKC